MYACIYFTCCIFNIQTIFGYVIPFISKFKGEKLATQRENFGSMFKMCVTELQLEDFNQIT